MFEKWFNTDVFSRDKPDAPNLQVQGFRVAPSNPDSYASSINSDKGRFSFGPYILDINIEN